MNNNLKIVLLSAIDNLNRSNKIDKLLNYNLLLFNKETIVSGVSINTRFRIIRMSI